jgi:dextranase
MRGSRSAPRHRVALAALFLLLVPAGRASAGALLAGVSTDRSAYAPGAPVTVHVDLSNQTGAAFSGTVVLSFFHLGDATDADRTQPVSLGAGQTGSFDVVWTPPPTDFRGYRVAVEARDGAQTVVDAAATAVDVSSDWKRFPRYGFLSRFDAGLDAPSTLRQLADFHLNGIQFYDWQWQHHRPYSPLASWPDVANRTIDRTTVESLIAEAHGRGMVAMAYDLAAAAYDGYWADGSGVQLAWGVFKDGRGNYDVSRQDFHPLPSVWATSRLFQFDPSNAQWQAYICAREQEVFDNFAFDGWHVDTLGNRGRLWRFDKSFVLLSDTFAGFVNAERSCLGKRFVFNTVGTYGQDQIAASADVDVIYSELWDDSGSDDFYDLKRIVDRVRAKTSKSIVFPGYMNYAYAKATPDGTTRAFDEPSVRLADAAMLALGATHLELGDAGAMLSSEYFPNQKLVMTASLRAAVRDLYDFQVAYENLLRDGTAPTANRIVLSGARSSTKANPRAVWAIVSAKPGLVTASLVNLTGSRIKRWRDTDATQLEPPLLTGLGVKLYHSLGGTPRVFVASPDVDHGAAHELAAIPGADRRGSYVSFTVPSLEYWDLIWLAP